MGSTTKCHHKHRRAMNMLETENMRAWLSLANTVLVTIAMVIWYFAIWQEEKGDIDESKIIIIENDQEESTCENETNTRSNEQDKEEYEKPKQTNKDDGNATKGEEDFIQVEQQDTESQNTRIVSDTFEWPRHKDTMEELRGCSYELEDDVLDRLESKNLEIPRTIKAVRK